MGLAILCNCKTTTKEQLNTKKEKKIQEACAEDIMLLLGRKAWDSYQGQGRTKDAWWPQSTSTNKYLLHVDIS